MGTFYYNTPNKEYDAIVVGTGISGGWAAKEFCEKGLKTLVLDRGKMIRHVQDYPTMDKVATDYKNGGAPSEDDIKRQPIVHRSNYLTGKLLSHFFVDDVVHPYTEQQRFDWIRSYQVGGRSLTWGRQSLRLSDLDFEANKKDGYGVDWPVRYNEIAPWYSHVERFIGVSGEKINIPHLPDGEFLPPMKLNAVEQHLKDSLHSHYSERTVTIGRAANITDGTKQGANRTTCQNRNKCMQGCPNGAYFSSNSSTLPVAENTGNMTLRTNAIVYEVIYDEIKQRATGVRVIDAETHMTYDYFAKVIFLCASTIPTTSILLQSKSKRFPNGMGNLSGELGHNLMDHHFKAGAIGSSSEFQGKAHEVDRPNSFYIPRFRNLSGTNDNLGFIRGYGYQGNASKTDWKGAIREVNYGQPMKEKVVAPGNWQMGLVGFGETLPYHENRMFLDHERLDKWGLPTIVFDAEFKNNEHLMRRDMVSQAVEMLERSGFKDIEPIDEIAAIGNAIHEMGTARMGSDPKTSVLNKYNQMHEVPNLFVTDGSFMTSSACQNPSLTYMAFTTRAVDYAIKELNKQNI